MLGRNWTLSSPGPVCVRHCRYPHGMALMTSLLDSLDQAQASLVHSVDGRWVQSRVFHSPISTMIRKSASHLGLSFLSTTSTTSTSSTSSCRSTFLASTTIGLEDPIEEWLYWQRDEAKRHCWTKVYAVLQNEFLLFFQQGSKMKKSLLLQIAVSTVEVSGDRRLRIVDPNGEGLEIYLTDNDSFECWRQRLQKAAMLTAEYFQFYEVDDVKRLPRNSVYRGSLVETRRIKTRTKCKEAIARLALRWRQSLLRNDRLTV